MSFTKLDYCQYLLSSPINYTVTNLADHLEGVSQVRINRYLRGEKLAPPLLWENVQPACFPQGGVSPRVEACQCRKARIQRNHIACALLG